MIYSQLIFIFRALSLSPRVSFHPLKHCTWNFMITNGGFGSQLITNNKKNQRSLSVIAIRLTVHAIKIDAKTFIDWDDGHWEMGKKEKLNEHLNWTRLRERCVCGDDERKSMSIEIGLGDNFMFAFQHRDRRMNKWESRFSHNQHITRNWNIYIFFSSSLLHTPTFQYHCKQIF